MKNIAIVGTGFWSNLMHLPTFKRLQSEGLVNYVGVCDIDSESAQAYAAELDSQAFSSITEMCKAVTPDGIVLLMPPHVTAALLQKEIIPLGIPFFTEKPPAPNNEAHQTLIDKTSKIPHVVGYNRRFSFYVQDAVKWLEGHDIQNVNSQFARCNRSDEDFSSTAVHGIDTTLFLTADTLKEADITVKPCAGVFAFFINGWTENNVRIDLAVTPMTGSSLEHYWIRSQKRSALVRFPQNNMIDYPGSVELHEENNLKATKTPDDYGISASDSPMLGGIYNEHTCFLDVIGGAMSPSTYASTWGTQQVRQALSDLIKNPEGGRVQLGLM
ncbi:MAG: Gfo/Idh/MocA family oxidoreductase [Planctomycetes bacterium]|nr:Gfo/Idh/MocA family oxidoreductase [Planctomycetota bacterium]